MEVFVLWHVRHARNLDGSPVQHRDESGELLMDEEFDDVKLIGVYSSQESMDRAIGRTARREGFRDEPDCFRHSVFVLDEDSWSTGFVRIPAQDDGNPA